MTTDTSYDDALRRLVDAAVTGGATTLHEVLVLCEGADPRRVAEYLQQRRSASPAAPSSTPLQATVFGGGVPAPDPLSSQWWFTVETVERLVTLAHREAGAGPRPTLLAVGTPTVALQFSRFHGRAVAVDSDPDLARTFDGIGALTFVAGNILDDELTLPQKEYDVAVADPPWYVEEIRGFLHFALRAVRVGGSVLCSLPPRMTRPTVISERQELLRNLQNEGVEFVSLTPQVTEYYVPPFEFRAYQDLEGFDGRPWRRGDLLHLRRTGDISRLTAAARPTQRPVTTYSLEPTAFRVFVRASENQSSVPPSIRREPLFEQTVSRRKFNPEKLDWWTSERVGGSTSDVPALESALQEWASGASLPKTVAALVTGKGLPEQQAQALVDALEGEIGLWSRHARVDREHLRQHISQHNLRVKQASKRPVAVVDDPIREQFQRDRDRIVWSRGFRQLANKTQVFPGSSDDFLRHRLSHSLEVAQLAGTLAQHFELNPFLVEAGALAHDIGHTPFGHAGEDALHHLLNEISPELGGFNHYEHGVDVVRWLEDPYQSAALGGLGGLNLTPEVADCIFKHTYCHRGSDSRSLEQLWARTKHRDYVTPGIGTLEAQTVRLADKVSYLVSDLEDGIRTGAFDLAALLSCALLRRPPLSLRPREGETLRDRFLAERSALIGILMNDVIAESSRRIARTGSPEALCSAKEYLIAHSPELQSELNEVWNKLQSGILHQDARVRIANMKAGQIVRELTLFLARAPECLEQNFVAAHRRLWDGQYLNPYRTAVGKKADLRAVRGADAGRLQQFSGTSTEVEHLVLAKDYVAGLSDERARTLHSRLLGP